MTSLEVSRSSFFAVTPRPRPAVPMRPWPPLARPGVVFVISVDPKGEDNEAFRCQNASLITKRMPGVPDEHEYLFTQYSVFTVARFVESPAPTAAAPHVIFLRAAQDNLGHPPRLPLAPRS